MIRILLPLMLLTWGAFSKASETSFVFVPGNPAASQGLALLESPALPPGGPDYYRRVGFSFRVTGALPPGTVRVYLIIDHEDRGLGLIQVRYDCDRPSDDRIAEDNPASAAASHQVGYTLLNTGKARHAIFQLDSPAFKHRQRGGADLRIEGLHSFSRARLTTALAPGEWEQAKREIPSALAPRVRLSRPIQLVVSAGADSQHREELPKALERMQEFCPLASALGFNGIEAYVKWNFVETEKGRFDWSYYDAVADEARKYGLRWFPLLIVGSAYTLPEWFYSSPLNEGFVCLEHRIKNDIQSIFRENQNPFVKSFLRAFGAHYEPAGTLLGVRLGPSGNYGESQYPAGGNWGYKWQKQHIHIGWWAGDPYASLHFRAFLAGRYSDIGALNRAWGDAFPSFESIDTFIPQFADSKRKRKDMVDWYMGAMSDWCERWALWARESMPHTDIYQSAGGWGFVESGTDFTDQTKSMVKIRGGIRATNETDSYAQNFYATRMMSSAARFYGVAFGSEPASFGSARGVAARLFNILVNNGQHLFFYFPNLLQNDQAVARWLELAQLLDKREDPFIEVAALYPDTKSKLDDAVFRNLYAFAFNQRVVALRPHLDFDFCSEQMVRDGALARYKVLLFLWNDVVEKDVLDAIDRWIQSGGTVFCPYWNRMPLGTVEDDFSVYNRWLQGECGRGKAIFYLGDREPPYRFADFIRQHLENTVDLDPRTRRMLRVRKPAEVYVSVLQSGMLAVLNYNDSRAQVAVPGSSPVIIEPYGIRLLK